MRIKCVVIAIFHVFVSGLLFNQTSFATENQLSENTFKRLNALQCDSLIQANEPNPNFVIFDVRTPGEWNSYHISGSINRSTGLTDFTEQLNLLPKHKIFLLHCQSGSRSAGAFAESEWNLFFTCKIRFTKFNRKICCKTLNIRFLMCSFIYVFY